MPKGNPKVIPGTQEWDTDFSEFTIKNDGQSIGQKGEIYPTPYGVLDIPVTKKPRNT